MVIDKVLNTDGRGYWSSESRAVRLVGLDIRPYEDGGCELRAIFDTSTWDVERHGLIYTDERFELELREFLGSLGLPARTVRYSEQGMQGDDYVSFDAGAGFADAWGSATV
jgi:hypothetical protein